MSMMNLLNWREARLKTENNKFYLLSGLLGFLGLLIIICIDIFVRIDIANVKKNVVYLNSEISQLDSKISEVKNLQSQKETLLSRRKVVESLQDSRTLSVTILDNLAKITPNGIIFLGLSKKEDSVSIDATGDSTEIVSSFVKNVNRLKWVRDTKLSAIQTLNKASSKNAAKNLDKKSGGLTPESRLSFKLQINISKLKPAGAK